MTSSLFKSYDKEKNEFYFEENKSGSITTLTLKKENLKLVKKLYALGEFTSAKVGEEGYYVIPRNVNQSSDLIISFDEREDFEYVQTRPIMALCGVKKKDACYLIRIPRNYYFD